MTRRIVLQLADDTTDTHCVSCRSKVVDMCMSYGVQMRRDPFMGARRHAECRSAELRPETVEAIRTELFAPQHAAELADFERLFGGVE